ncbi:MAG: sulfotransferase family protein [Roseivirga sp.]|nr:sulfotransferase family protein [Roseivirga sp.]
MDNTGKKKGSLVTKALDKSFIKAFNLREKLMPGFPAWEFNLAQDDYHKNLYRANYLTIRGDRKKSVELLVRILRELPNDRRTNLNLSFLIAQDASKVLADHAYGLISQLKVDVDTNDHFARTLCELLLTLEDRKAKEVTDHYIENFLLKDLIKPIDKNQKPIFFWHIPKCAGTSISTYISSQFYKHNHDFFPGSHTPLFLKLLTEEKTGLFPYISSAHFGLSVFDREAINDNYFQIGVVRDPKSRSISSWRQYYDDPLKRLAVLQQHGSIWDYWPRASLKEWSERAPVSHSNYLVSTFSSQMDADDAFEFAKGIDYLASFKNISASIQAVCERYGLEFSKDAIPTKLNSTNKSLTHSSEDELYLEEALQLDLSFYNRIEPLLK